MRLENVLGNNEVKKYRKHTKTQQLYELGSLKVSGSYEILVFKQFLQVTGRTRTKTKQEVTV